MKDKNKDKIYKINVRIKIKVSKIIQIAQIILTAQITIQLIHTKNYK
jgi:hypothetical protein